VGINLKSTQSFVQIYVQGEVDRTLFKKTGRWGALRGQYALTKNQSLKNKKCTWS